MTEHDERIIVHAAQRYVHARVRCEGGSGADMLTYAVELDEAWHALHLACGVAVADCCDGDDAQEVSHVRAGHYVEDVIDVRAASDHGTDDEVWPL